MTILAAAGHTPDMGAILVDTAGSVRDFTGVYHREFDYVWSCLRAMGVPDAELEDAAQAVFLVVHRRLAEFDGRAQLRTWLFAIAARVASRGRRDRARTHRRLVALADAVATTPTTEGLDESLAARETMDRLARFTDGLDGGMREVFRRWFFDGQTPQEIADALGLSRNTVFSRLRLIRGRLQRECERIAAHDHASLEVAARRHAKRRVRAVVLGLGTRAPTWVVALAASFVGVATLAAIGEPMPSGKAVDPIVHASLDPVDRPPPPTPVATLPHVPMEAPRAPVATQAPAARRAAIPGGGAAGQPEVELPTKADEATDLAASVALLAEIRAAIADARDDVAARAIRRHADAFPNGPLQVEREGFAAIVACRADRRPAPAQAFVAAHPGLSLSRRIASICPMSSDDGAR